MLDRKINDVLLNWKTKNNHNPIIIKGCRQCGKTFSVKYFCEQNYKNVVYLNFLQNPEFSSVFNGSLEVDHLIMLMSAIIGKKTVFEPNNTVIILDEIQECPEARTALKFFKLDGRYDVIGTGSLLGVKGYGKSPKSIPVGFETIVDMYPLDFEEFLWANGINKSIIEYLKDNLQSETPVPDALHKKLKDLLNQYVVVGGMPAVVDSFVLNKNMNEIYDLQQNIVRDYEDDMVKYADNSSKPYIKDCFLSIPKQLAKENKKFQYSKIENHGRSSEYKAAIQWLVDAGIVNKCCALNNFEQPLDGNANPDIFKLYMQDSGLFLAMFEKGIAGHILSGDLGIYKGAIYENIIADAFSKMGRKLYYYSTEGGLEIDFVITYDFETTLIEVKATNGKTKSSNYILSRYNDYKVKKLIKLGEYNIGEIDNKLTIPYYLAFLLK